MRRADPTVVFTRLVSIVRGYGRGELDEGVLVMQKDATQDGFDIWVAVVDHGGAGDMTADVVLTRADRQAGEERRFALPLVRYHLDRGRVRGVPASARFFHNHATVADLDADTVYQVAVEIENGGRAGCVARTLPRRPSSDRSLRIFVGSCYDFGTDPEDRLDRAHQQLFRDEPPDLTLLMGDQVYADAPIVRYAPHAQRNPRADLLLKYWTTWGMSHPRSVTGWQRFWPRRPAYRTGLRSVLGTGPNYFLPDDHEFWNNWPNQAVTARHSYAAVFRGLKEARRRGQAELRADETLSLPPVRPGAEPQEPPASPVEQNYLPVHPAERERWSLASFELFEAFQTRSRADRTGRPTRGLADERRVGPPDATSPLTHPPRNEILQTVQVDPITLCLLDTRTRRTRSLRHPVYARFVDDHYLAAMLRHARTAEIFVLVTPQPLLHAAAWADEGPERSSPIGDVDLWDYGHQWQQLWTELIAARGGRPTVVVGGDIHQSYIAFAPGLNLVEVVSSPMSRVWGSGPLEWYARIFGGNRLGYDPGSPFVALPDIVAGPEEAPAVPDGHAVARGGLAKNEDGFARLTFEQAAPDSITFTAELFRRDDLAAGSAAAAVTGRYTMAIGGADTTGPTVVDVSP